MLKKNSLEGLSFFQLKENYPIKPFDCEDDDLNDFLFNKALLYQKELLATTFIVEDKERTLGYYSVLNDSLQLKEEDFPSKSKYKNKTYKGKGLGMIFIRNVIRDCVELNRKIACRLITVDAYKGALTFYQKLGFEFLTEKDNNEDIRQMFFDLTNLDN